MFSLNINNADTVTNNIEAIRNMVVPENWTLKKKDMHAIGVNAEEIFEGVVKTFHDDFPYKLFVDLNNGETYWYNTNRYVERIVDNKIQLKKKSGYIWETVYENGTFYPTARVYLLNGYSWSGKEDLKYASIKLKNKGRKSFVPRIHQLIALFGFGVETFNCLEKDRTLEINHLDQQLKFWHVTNNALKDLEITTKEGNVEYREKCREYPVLPKQKGEISYEFQF
jgi:hypothetical protein